MMTIIGLGNPGKEYKKTRHNVGFLFVEYLQEKLHTPQFSFQSKHNLEVSSSKQLVLLKPQTFMNESGKAVQSYLRFYDKNWSESVDTLYVAFDDLDIEFGSYKIQFGTGPKVHNGVNSVYDYLHTDQVWHIRIGIDGRGGTRTIPGKEYVLSSFSAEEQMRLIEVFEAISTQLGI